MKRVIPLALILLCGHAFAATRYVGSCGSPTSASVAAAIVAASAGDSILICPGTYTEAVTVNKDNLTLRGASGNRAAVTVTNAGVPFTLTGANITLKDMTLTSTNNKAIKREWTASPSAYTFENLAITARDKGVHIDVSGKVSFTNVSVSSSDGDAIYLAGASNGAHVFDTVSASAPNGYGIYTYNGGATFKDLTVTSKEHALYMRPNYDASFTNINAISSNGGGIYMEWVASGKALTFSNINVNAKERGIHIEVSALVSLTNVTATSSNNDAIRLDGASRGAHVFDTITATGKNYGIYTYQGGGLFKDLTVTAQNNSAIYLRPSYDASFTNITATSTNDHGIYMEWVASGKALNFSNINVTAKNKGVYVEVAGALSFRDMVVASSNSHAIHLGWAASGAHVFNNLTLDAQESGILLEDSAPSSTISNVCVNSGKYGVNVAQWHARNVAIDNSKFTNTTYGVRVEADPAYKTIVSNSCFVKSTTPRAYSNSTTHRFTGNYWQGVAGGTSYSDGNVRDTATLASCPVSACYSGAAPTPIGEWRLEETSWNGTAGEVRDSSGNNLHGKAIGSPNPAPASAAPARAGNPGTCGYGGFAGPAANGGAIELSGLPVSTVTGAKTTVSFWMYWNGGDNMMPIGWNTHDLWLVSGSFGFNTGNSDVFGIASAGLANRWVHVAAVFTNGSVTGNALYLDGVRQSLTQRRSTPNNTTAKVQSTLRISGWQRDNYYRFNGRIDEVRVYNAELTASAVAALVGETHACATAAAVCANPVYAGSSLSVGEDSEINHHDITGSGNTINPDTGVRSTATQTLGALSPAAFPSFSGGSDYSGSASSLTPGATYDDVTLTSGTAPSGTYYMDTLTLDGAVTFSGGTYYVNTLSIDKEENIDFTAVTDFRINSLVTVDKEVDLRASGAAVGSVPARFYLYGSADFTADKEGRMDGIVVAAGSGNSITFDKEWEITGALITPGAISIGKDAEFTYNAAVSAALSSSGICGGGTVAPTPPANFNCVEVGASGSSGHLYTKLVGTNFNFDIVALKADGTLETSYASDANKAVSVQLVDGSGNTACTSRTSLIAWPGQTFTSANAGRITASSASVAGAYANLRCRVSDGSVTGCSSDNFSIRPTAFTVTSANANADATGTSASAVPIVKTGAAFALTATAMAGYSGTPTLDAGKVQAHGGAIQAGALGGSFGAANAATGAASGSVFNYSEVGYFRLAANGVADTSFTSVDAANSDCSADYSNTAVGGKYGCYFGNTASTGYFGRFTPDRFAVTAGVLTQGCGNFTYYGQDFSTAFTLEALNSANSITQNYTGNFARLGLTDWNNFGFAAAGTTLQQGDSPPQGSWSNGNASVTAVHRSLRASSGVPQARANIEVTAQVSDSDGVTMTAASVATAAAPHRFGRLRITNTLGSEMLALPVPLTAQYWNDAGFVTNTDDNCTVLTAPALTFYAQSADNHLASGETTASFNATLTAGNGNLRFSAPGVGNFGFLDLSVAAPAWLQYNRDGVDQAGDGNLFDDNPRARAAFGKRKGSDKVIIRREIY